MSLFKGKGARIAFAALLAAFRRAINELAFEPVERAAINEHIETAQAALDSDGDGVADDLDPAPHDATIRTAREAAEAAARDLLPGLVEAAVLRAVSGLASEPVKERVDNGGMPTNFAAQTLPPVENGTARAVDNTVTTGS